ncbi:hypothetical protein B0T26DRAFT_669632 [Lasiosphaeria miniovina]|uniref:Ubiquitin-like domain-containing protein n=1 Tax=Lasiosphaeria miniovina TaxID=1954250 RepID=A0AA40E9E1_9PEZI|nr:uncharacterized protein B0T26DRAFT_669632 [Lasiosphaeria miniovina]KAK0733204.1 hypothetical protein B0T26DRAFT_669632 [Lasiosphaeria miniovina]
MSLGFPVGDVVAILSLLERIIAEIRSYHGAPRHFQQLLAELEMHSRTIQTLLSIEPTHAADHEIVDRLRAISLHCSQSLQNFLAKMHGLEKDLGPFRVTTPTLQSIGARLNWSMVGKKDVDELRKILQSKMLAINILQGTLQLNQIQRMAPELRNASESHSNSLSSVARQVDLLRDVTTHAATVAPSAVADLKRFVVETSAATAEQFTRMEDNFSGVQANLQSVTSSLDQVIALSRGLTTGLRAGLTRLFSLVLVLVDSSANVLRVVTQNTSTLLDIQNNIQRLTQAVNRVPLQLSIQFIRFDDALGESWALPFQLCEQWETFKEMLRVIVFRNDRPGFQGVLANRFTLRVAGSHSNIFRHRWERVIKPGLHIEQTTLVPELSTQMAPDLCSFSRCSGSPQRESDKSNDDNWQVNTDCGRLKVTEQGHENLVTLLEKVGMNLAPDSPPVTTGTMNRSLSELAVKAPYETPTSPRRVETFTPKEPLKNMKQPWALYSQDRADPSTRRFAGWWVIVRQSETLRALPFSVRASEFHDLHWTVGSQSDYFLSCHCCDVGYYSDDGSGSGSGPGSSAEPYVECVVGSPSPDYFNSIALLYYDAHDWKDCLYLLANALRADPLRWEFWFNLGVLYDTAHQLDDSLDSFKRCLQLNPTVNYARQRLDGQRPLPVRFSTDVRMIETAVSQVSDKPVKNRDGGRHNPVPVPSGRKPG